jgi:hypothetical protein
MLRTRFGADPVGARRHLRAVVFAGTVRRSASQRCTCFGAPGKPRARSSRHSSIAFSQPAATRASR